MCGRFTLRTPTPVLIEHFGLGRIPPLPPRFNVAPTQDVAAVRQAAGADTRTLVMLRWGLIPSWAKDPSIGNRMINARAETVADKPSFRAAFRRRRCLILADGFYEWKKEGGQKQPYHIGLESGQPFAFAGLWESWPRGANDADPITESCTIITTEANSTMRTLHDRMPVILAEEDYTHWLDPELQDPDRLQPLLVPHPADDLVATPVSTYVNKPTNDDPQCLEPS